MDARSLICVCGWLILGWSLSGCLNQRSPEEVCPDCYREERVDRAASSEDDPCAVDVIENSYVVRWNSGEISTHKMSQRDFQKRVLEKHLQDISYAQSNRYIQLQEPVVEREMSAFFETPSDWGVHRIDATSVWERGYRGQGVRVAVIDSGVDPAHAQLSPNIYRNQDEIPDNGIDDDGNGYIDDVHGCSFLTGSENPNQAIHCGSMDDDNGHGTHVAGVIAASDISLQDQERPFFGVAPEAEILPIRFLSGHGGGTLADAIAAIRYARHQGAKIINASWGGRFCGPILRDVIEETTRSGVLFVAAAGNSGGDLDLLLELPAAFRIEGQITVGASTYNDYMAGFSNYSFERVQLIAPGAFIYSTVPKNSYEVLSGTSMAAPFVAGAAALLASAVPEATPAQLAQALMQGVEKFEHIPAATQGRLNVENAYRMLLAQ